MGSNLIAKPLKQVKTDTTKTIAPRIHVFSIFISLVGCNYIISQQPNECQWGAVKLPRPIPTCRSYLLVLLLLGVAIFGFGEVDVHAISHPT